MRTSIIIAALTIIGLTSCGRIKHHDATAADDDDTAYDRVEVIYFHGKQRCPTCVAIEECTKQVIDSAFANEIKDGTVVFRTVDISTDEGEAIANNYEVTWSSLFVNDWKDGKEARENLTEFGFATARAYPDSFKTVLTETIRKSLR